MGDCGEEFVELLKEVIHHFQNEELSKKVKTMMKFPAFDNVVILKSNMNVTEETIKNFYFWKTA